MKNKAIEYARDNVRKTLMSEIQKEVLSTKDFKIDFKAGSDKPPVRINNETIVYLRYERGRILTGIDSDGIQPDEEDLELYSIDEMLTLAETIFS